MLAVLPRSGALFVAAVVLAACATAFGGQSAPCDPVQHPPLQAGGHLIGGQKPPVPYSSVPPTSGWHSSGHVDIGVHGPADPLTAPEQVSVLEAGGVVAAYRDLPEEEVRALESLVDEHDGVLAATPYGALEPGQVALTAWGVLQLCDGVDADAVSAFVESHASENVGTPGEH